MTEAALLDSADRDGVRLLTLNRPEKLNALNAPLIGTLIAAVEEADRDDTVGVIVLAGAGRAFSAGADMGEAAEHAGDTHDAARRHAEAVAPVWRLGTLTDKPLLAAVHGYALGGGTNLALACDMVIAAKSAVFGYPELKRGLAATIVTPSLVHQIGRKAAFELLTLAENVAAERALALGLVNRVVDDDALLDEAQGIAAVLNGYDRAAVRATKRVFQAATRLGLDDALKAARETMLLMREAGRDA